MAGSTRISPMAKKNYSVKMSSDREKGLTPAKLGRMNPLDRSILTGVPLKDKNSKRNKTRVNLS